MLSCYVLFLLWCLAASLVEIVQTCQHVVQYTGFATIVGRMGKMQNGTIQQEGSMACYESCSTGKGGGISALISSTLLLKSQNMQLQMSIV
jgi:hypothetical protein